MKLEAFLDNLHAKLTSNKFLQIFTAFTRILLFVGFTPPSIKKILHEPFTSLPDSNPVGHYFNALLETRSGIILTRFSRPDFIMSFSAGVN
jgi:hypothetical protein